MDTDQTLAEKTAEALLKEHTVKVFNNQLLPLLAGVCGTSSLRFYINRIYAAGGGWTNPSGSRPMV